MTWTEADDERVKELCKTADVGRMTSCPKCGMGSEGFSEMALTPFCTHKYCPFRDWRLAKLAAERPELAETQPRVTDDDRARSGSRSRGASCAAGPTPATTSAARRCWRPANMSRAGVTGGMRDELPKM